MFICLKYVVKVKLQKGNLENNNNRKSICLKLPKSEFIYCKK